jgi:hypothetical protein
VISEAPNSKNPLRDGLKQGIVVFHYRVSNFCMDRTLKELAITGEGRKINLIRFRVAAISNLWRFKLRDHQKYDSYH